MLKTHYKTHFVHNISFIEHSCALLFMSDVLVYSISVKNILISVSKQVTPAHNVHFTKEKVGIYAFSS